MEGGVVHVVMERVFFNVALGVVACLQNAYWRELAGPEK